MYKLSISEFLMREGMTLEEFITNDDYMLDSIVPAMCSEGCEVEPDGHCEHGNPSILLELGLI